MRDKNNRRRVRKVYGHNDHEYDQFLGGLFKSKHKKKEERREITQRDANIDLTRKQSQAVSAKLEAETYRARKAQMEALTAQKQAEKADTQLSGAKATTQLKYVGLAIAAIVGIGAVALTIYMVKQSKKSALISAQLKKAKLAAVPA